MVKALHRAGIEVILDVVYNHTGEGNHLGPDALAARDRQRRVLPAGARRPPPLHRLHRHRQQPEHARTRRTLQLIMDSLRYWVDEMHVDGFRFDLAPVLGAGALRGQPARRRSSTSSQQDPVLSQVKLIAEPWDLGDGRLPGGQLPGRAGPSGTASTATQSAASGAATPARCPSWPPGCRARATCTQASGRRTYASINFVTAHDGFTLNDLV